MEDLWLPSQTHWEIFEDSLEKRVTIIRFLSPEYIFKLRKMEQKGRPELLEEYFETLNGVFLKVKEIIRPLMEG